MNCEAIEAAYALVKNVADGENKELLLLCEKQNRKGKVARELERGNPPEQSC